jgi:hypothetical protein
LLKKIIKIFLFALDTVWFEAKLSQLIISEENEISMDGIQLVSEYNTPAV